MKKLISLFMVLCLILSLFPGAVMAQEQSDTGTGHENGAKVLYSDHVLIFDQASSLLEESSGDNAVTLTRITGIDETQQFTLAVYDTSANYDRDYRIFYNGAPLEKAEGSASIYDVFRDQGQVTSGQMLDLAVMASQVECLEKGQEPQDVSAAEMLYQLDQLGVKAAVIPVTFEAGETAITLTIEVLEDQEPEYDENFMLAMLDQEGQVVETAQQIFTILDNDSPAPGFEVSFDCEALLELDQDSGEAELVFKRTGDLATNSQTALCLDGEPLGWVDFAPWQESQTVWVVQAGTYTLLDQDGYPQEGQAVEVEDHRPTVTAEVGDGADPELDAVPEEYAVIRAPRQAANTDWLPGWAAGTEADGEYASIILGSVNNSLFKEGGNTSKGELKLFVSGNNFHDLSTSGTGSRVSTGYLYADSISSYDFTGVESITADVYTEGVDGQAQLSIGVQDTARYDVTIEKGGKYSLTVKLPNKFQGTKYVYYENADTSWSSGGISMYVPNGFKMNLRKYRFVIDSSKYVTPLTYTGGTKPGEWVPHIAEGKDVQYMSINSRTYGKNKTVDIVYACDSQYPARLIGYKLYNAKTNKFSDMISLTGENDGMTGSASFTFDAKFLKAYEADYCCLMADANGTEAWTFQVVPVYEKIPLSFYTILPTREGTIQMLDTWETHYLGDYVVFEDPDSDATLSSVWYQAKSNISDSIKDQGTSENRYDDGANQFKVNLLYDRYTFKGKYTSEANKLVVYYRENGSTGGGRLEKEGQVVSPEQYVTGDYVSLMAKARDGYVTEWDVAGAKYYGDIFYLQLDGDSDKNIVYADFPVKETVTSTLTGNLKRAYVELRSGSTSYVAMPYTQITVTAGKTYTVTTDRDGNFTIPDFTGVSGGVYSMAVNYENIVGYTQFTYEVVSGSGTDSVSRPVSIQVAQFAAGEPYPDTVNASVDGVGTNQNMLSLTTDGTLKATVYVYQPPKNYKVTGVNFYFMNEQLAIAGATADATAFEAACTEISGNIQTWTVSIPTEQLIPGTKMYVEIVSDKDIYLNQSDGTSEKAVVSLSSSLVDCGYALTVPNEEKVYYANYDILPTPGLNNAASIDLSKLNLPNLGNLDFSVSSITGGFFSSRNDANGDLVLSCGSSYLTSFVTGPVSEKLAMKQQTRAAIAEKKASKALSDRPVGGSDTTVTAVTPGDAQTGNGSLDNTSKKPSSWAFSPAFIIKMVVTKGASDPSVNYISLYEMSLGVDANFARNIPFNINGLPLYICITFTTEAYFDLQVAFKEDSFPLLNFLDNWKDMLASGGFEDIDFFLAAPVMQMGITGGVGYNGFLNAYIRGIVSAPFIFSLTPVDAAVQPALTLGGGINVVVFDLGLSATVKMDPIGDEQLIKDLKTIMASAATGTVNAAAPKSGNADLEINTLDELQELDLTAMFDEGTFSVMERGGSLRRSSRESGCIAADVFEDTGIHLLKLENGTILAFFLQDTAGDDPDTLNWLTVSYAVSTDDGETWTSMGYIADNTGDPNTSLQFDIDLFQLEDRTLVTWSEANFDEVLENLGDADITRLTPAQIAKFMNAMDLKGRFISSETGEPLSEPFTIAENSTVACGALDAVQNGSNVYVYYQRNVFPYDESEGEVTVSQLLSTERTIALARCNVNEDVSQWTSTSVRAANENGQEYRITDVEPFVHDGIMGEILVLDRDGRLAEWDESTETWQSSTEDRQLYLRTYGFREDGTPEPSALMAFTDPNVCAQSPETVSNGDYLHLFWNQDGKVVYVSDFAATYNDNADLQEAAYVLKNRDGTVTAQNQGVYTANYIASDDSFHVGTTFSAAMDEDGNVLLSWIATDTQDTNLLPTDEIYGVVLNTVTNAEAASLSAGETVEGSDDLYQLYAQGSPVALTQEDSLISCLDSVFLKDSSFLLAFSRLNDTDRTQVTSADIKAVRSVYEPQLVITQVDSPKYPMPGSKASLAVTLANRGLGTAENITVTANGIGDGGKGTIASLKPGCEATLELTIDVPESFSQSTQLTVTAAAAGSSDTALVDALYGPHFEVYDMPVMTSIPGTRDYLTETLIYNAGNAPGIPLVDFAVDLFARDDQAVKYSCTAQEELAPGGTMELTYVLEDTPVEDGTTGVLTVTTGSGADQYIQGHMPRLEKYLDLSDISGVKPSQPDEPDKPDEPEVPAVPAVPGKPGGTVAPSQEEEAAPSEDKAPATFTDVAPEAYYHEAVQWAVERGITTGISDSLFDPGAYCTRAQAVTFLWRYAGCPKAESRAMPFADVPENAYYREAVLWAVEQGITTGISDSLFDPGAYCTRAQIVTFIYRYQQSQDGGFQGAWMFRLPFTDTPEWAFEAIAWCYMKGITTGISDTAFGPDAYCTRAQIVTFLWRYSRKK